MIWTRIFNKNKSVTDRLLIILPAAVIFALIIFLILFTTKELLHQKEIKFYPEKTISINESFSGKLHFNDILGLDNFSELIISGINGAKDKIEIAMYSMDSVDIRDALFKAAERGVQVNLVFSDKHQISLQRFFENAPGGFQIVYVGKSADQVYMHHKFLIVDRGLDGQKLFFGSYNFTDIQGKFDPSFILETDRPEVVSIFGEELDRLSNLDSWTNKRHNSYNPFAALINYPEGYLEIWFTPESEINSLKTRMMTAINRAQEEIKALIWHLTDRDIAATFVATAKRLPTIIVADDFNFFLSESMLPVMLAQKNRQDLENLEIIQDTKRSAEVAKILKDDSLNSFLHHHTLLIDNNLVVFGTNNWSFGGFKQNDESVMISNIPWLVEGFLNSFKHNYQAAN